MHIATSRSSAALILQLALIAGSLTLLQSYASAKKSAHVNLASVAVKSDLVGRIVSPGGVPIADAAVMIYTAAPRTGHTPYCPSCYADCGKRVRTDTEGRFRIAALSPTLLFNVLAVKSGRIPTFQEKVDPLKGNIQISLPERPISTDPHHFISGRVLGFNGSPVVGAKVTPVGIEYAGGGGGAGTIEEADPVAVTDEKGEFAIQCKLPDAKLKVIVEARGLADGAFGYLKSGGHADLKLTDGVTVRGQVLRNGKPLPNATVGLVQVDKEVETFFGPMTIGTDAHGRFQFYNVAPRRDYFLYGVMRDMRGLGGVALRKITAADDDSTFNAGKISSSPAHVVRGRVVLADGKDVPLGTQLVVNRTSAWDSEFVEIDAQGNYVAEGLPGEPLQMSVTIPGYRLSPQNAGFYGKTPDWLTVTPSEAAQTMDIEMTPAK